MVSPLSAREREQVVGFDPFGSVSVAAFCRELGISTSSFYRVRARAAEEGVTAALTSRSRAPLKPARRFDEFTDQAIRVTRLGLIGEGWDAGPWSIWWVFVQEGLSPCPSRATIARRLLAMGLVEPSPKKRPRSSYRRFARSRANELWQLDGLEWKLTDATTVTIYQIVDDCSRLLIALLARPGGETTDAAIETLSLGIKAYGAPSAVLTDNGTAFNQHRRGRLSATERWLAAQGIRPISGSVGKPRTQGKVERAHQPLQKWLEQHPADTTDHLNQLLDRFAEHYNQRRQHQGLGLRMTPAMVWQARPKAGPLDHPINPADLYSRQPLSLPPTPQGVAFDTRQVSPNGRISIRGVVLNFGIAKAGATMHFTLTADQTDIFDADGVRYATIPWPPPQPVKGRAVSLLRSSYLAQPLQK